MAKPTLALAVKVAAGNNVRVRSGNVDIGARGSLGLVDALLGRRCEHVRLRRFNMLRFGRRGGFVRDHRRRRISVEVGNRLARLRR